MNVITETLALPLPAMPKFACIAGPHIGALEVTYEGVLVLGPIVDPPSREVHEPGTR
jgi:hypothetical protein